MTDEDRNKFKLGRRFRNSTNKKEWVIARRDEVAMSVYGVSDAGKEVAFDALNFDSFFEFIDDLPKGTNETLPPVPKCECGQDGVPYAKHSDYCRLYVKDYQE